MGILLIIAMGIGAAVAVLVGLVLSVRDESPVPFLLIMAILLGFLVTATALLPLDDGRGPNGWLFAAGAVVFIATACADYYIITGSQIS